MAISDDRRARLNVIRANGAKAYRELLDDAFAHITDPLDRLAFVAGTIRTPEPKTKVAPPFNFRLYSLEVECKEDGRTWADIAEALGVKGDGNARLVRRRNEARHKLLGDHRRSHTPGGGHS